MQPLLQIAAAFAARRDAERAVHLASASIDERVRFSMREIIGEDGYVQLVVLEAAFDSPALASRLTTIMSGSHGVVVSTTREPGLSAATA